MKRSCMLLLLLSASLVWADDSQPGEVEVIVVTGEHDDLGVLPSQPVESVFGFDKTLLDTPRSASSVTEEILARFNITDIDELIALAPGTFTQSFFGVAGSLDIRGTAGEVYFRGVRRINNPGNYPTPIGAADRIDIVRGPASPIFGPSKIGGYLNFIPKSARAETGQYLDAPAGEVSITHGSWEKNVLVGETGGPARLFDKEVGYYLYGEIEDSGSYYRNSQNDQAILQGSFNMELSPNSRIEAGAMYHDFDGNQVAGWNRLSQDLIDDGTYVTGSPLPLDTDNDGAISPSEVRAVFVDNNFTLDPSFVVNDDNPASTFIPLDVPAYFALQNPGIGNLDGDEVLVADSDALRNRTYTVYLDYIYEFDSGLQVTNKVYFEALENLNENAYGFSQFADTWVVEDQVVFELATEHTSWLQAAYQFSPSIRYTEFEHADDFDFEFFDRRDLTKSSTPLDNRLLSTRTDQNWSTYFEGDYSDYGVALLADYALFEHLHVLLGGRYDWFDIESEAQLDKLLNPAAFPADASDSDGDTSWSVSVSYDLPYNLRPYVTLSEQSTLLVGQGSEIGTDIITNGFAIASSELTEIGIKGAFLDGRLYAALAWYDQERTSFNAQDLVSNQTTKAEGYEAEIRWAVTDNFVLTGAYTNLEVRNLTAEENGSQFSFYGADDLVNIPDPSIVYGFLMIGLIPVDSGEDAKKAGVPENLWSVTGTYRFQNGWAVFGGVTDVDETSSAFSGTVELPSYTLLNLGLAYEAENWTLSINGKNLTDEEYFRANFTDLFGAQIVLPELPRNYSATLMYRL